MNWKDSLDAVFTDRSELDQSALCREFGIQSASECRTLVQCLRVFEEEYGIPIGLLRPADPLKIFLEPPRTRNPIRWLFNRAAIEDRTSELSYTLKLRREHIGVSPRPLVVPQSVEDYVLAWMGRIPFE
jgi:hypothetical protein